MNLMPIPDKNFETLLRDYGTDTLDDEFSDNIFAEIEAQSARQAKAKRICLIAAVGIGAIIAGLQVQSLFSVVNDISFGGFSSKLTLPVGAVLSMMLCIWLMEQKEVSL